MRMTPRASLSFLRLLSNLRWLAVVGQALTVLLVVGPLHIPLHTAPLWSGIAALALFNVYATLRVRRTDSGTASDAEVCVHTLIDITALTWMIAASGGMENPFASLFLIPIAMAILALPPPLMGLTAVLAVVGYFVSTLFGRELPPVAAQLGGPFGLHKIGMLANFGVSALVILFFFTRMTAAWRRSEREVAQLREQFTRNEGIVALATHAAAVAHELNTPLGTMTFMVDDLAREARTDAERQELATLKALVDICRDRVRQLAAPAEADSHGGRDQVSLDHVIQQWQLVRPAVELHRSGSIAGFEKVDPAVGHLLQALLNNAADAGEQAGIARVDLHLQSDEHGLRGEIRDYGVGFDEARPPLPAALFRSSKPKGLGIGLALSHATIERLGGELSMQATDGRGVRVEFSLPAATT
ncbi:MAG TPA: ATP-binding protein [Steroidobacteraceae bacterium]|nr:ATP-binding protein [Steroidobacteraceae bacterium]